MIIFILVLLMIIISSAKFYAKDEFNKNYLSISYSNVIKGIFVVLVFLGHSLQYVELDGVLDKPYLELKSHLGQMVVAMFMFYSGFGLICSVMKKKNEYIKKFFRNRILTVFINFAIAVTLFVIVNILLDIQYDIKTVLLSYIGWTNIGNSNWYMLAMFCLYFLFFISFIFWKNLYTKKNILISLIIFTILTIGLVYAFIRVGKEKWYYDTLILFVLGSWYGFLKEYIERIVQKNIYVYTMTVVIFSFAYWYSSEYFNTQWIVKYSVWGVVFTLTIVLVSMKVEIKSAVLEWLGRHVFGIYILQRIPMLILKKVGLLSDKPYMFVMVSFIVTLGLAVYFDIIIKKANMAIIKKNG